VQELSQVQVEFSPYFGLEHMATQILLGELSAQEFEGQFATQILLEFSANPLEQVEAQ